MLDALLNASRPFKSFSVKIGDIEVKMLARKPGAIEAQKISNAWTDCYEAAQARIAEKDVDASLLARNLKNQPAERLAQYISKADRLDLLGEAQILCDDKPADDPLVVAKLDELVLAREKDLMASETHESLIQMALERKSHIQALMESQVATVRTSVLVMTFNEDKTPAFASEEELMQLPESTIEEIFTAASKALEPPKDSPLTSAASKQ